MVDTIKFTKSELLGTIGGCFKTWEPNALGKCPSMSLGFRVCEFRSSEAVFRSLPPQTLKLETFVSLNF